MRGYARFRLSGLQGPIQTMIVGRAETAPCADLRFTDLPRQAERQILMSRAPELQVPEAVTAK
jgi:hypothetical protein